MTPLQEDDRSEKPIAQLVVILDDGGWTSNMLAIDRYGRQLPIALLSTIVLLELRNLHGRKFANEAQARESLQASIGFLRAWGWRIVDMTGQEIAQPT